MRDLSHLINTPILVKGFLSTWKPNERKGYIGALLTHVKLLEYSNGKNYVAPIQDHCWLWIPENSWATRYKTAIVTEKQSFIHDEVWACCHVSLYMRSDSTTDYGLVPRNEFPISPEQARILRSNYQKLKQRFRHFDDKKLCQNWASTAVYKSQLSCRVADWRELAYSHKTATTLVQSTFQALSDEVQARNLPEELVTHYFNAWRQAMIQTEERLGELTQWANK